MDAKYKYSLYLLIEGQTYKLPQEWVYEQRYAY
jgi:hypothetical protein